MTAYALSLVRVTDPDTFRAYTDQVSTIVERHGGRYVTVDDAPLVLEGDTTPGSVVLIRFDDAAAARGWYESAEYQAIVPIRHGSADTTMILFEGE